MIRAATKADCLNIAALSIQVWLRTYAIDGVRKDISNYVFDTFTEAHFSKLIDNSDYRTLIFTENEHLLGYIIINLDSFFEDRLYCYEVDTLYVQEHFHGRGIGRRLLNKVAEKYGSNFWLSTWIKNTNAIDFYQHIGLTIIGKSTFILNEEKIENTVLGSL